MKLRRRSPERRLTGERLLFPICTTFQSFTFLCQAQRELDDYVESNEGMNREINNLKNKLR